MESAFNPLAVLMLLTVLAGLVLRLPAPLALAGGALLGTFLGQLLGVYHLVLLGDLASLVASVLDNEILVAIPLLVLSGTLLGESSAFLQLRARLKGPFSALPCMLLAVAGGGGAARSPLVGLLERAAPASAFLVLLGDLLDRIHLTAELTNPAPDFAVALMTVLALPALLLAVGLGLAGQNEKTTVGEGPALPAILAGLAALIVPALILSRLASPAEAGAAGVGLALVLRARWRQEGQCRLGDCLDHALQRAAIPFATLIAGLTFHLVFNGIGGQEGLNAVLASVAGPSSFFLVLGIVALLGLVVEPLALAVLLLPLVGPFLLGQGHDILAVGVLFALAPLPGAISLRPRLVMAAFQGLALASYLLFPTVFESSNTQAVPPEQTIPMGREEEGFTPVDTTDAPQHNPEDDRHFAPPSENE